MPEQPTLSPEHNSAPTFSPANDYLEWLLIIEKQTKLLTDGLNEVKREIQAPHISTISDLKNDIKCLDVKIDVVEKNLNDKIDRVEKNLNNKIDGVEKNLSLNFNNKIDGVEKNLNDKIDRVEKNLSLNFNNKIDGVENNLNNKIDRVEKTLA